MLIIEFSRCSFYVSKASIMMRQSKEFVFNMTRRSSTCQWSTSRGYSNLTMSGLYAVVHEIYCIVQNIRGIKLSPLVSYIVYKI